jgi:hypothetical protein
MIHIPWTDTYDLDTKVNLIIDQQKYFQPTKLNGLSATLSPNISMKLKHIFTCGSINSLKNASHLIQPIIMDCAKINNKFVSIIDTDFIDNDYIIAIIKLNYK